MRRIQGILIVAVALMAFTWGAARRDPVAVLRAAVAAEAARAGQDRQYLGAASCAAAACHNANGPRGSKGSEYTTWVLHDKHARAHEVLSEPLSQQIVRNLYGPRAQPAETTALCLNCHVQPHVAALHAGSRPVARGPHFSLADGVGCEACHGPAQKWVAEHYTDAWKRKAPAEKARLGFQDTKDLLVRARACVTCHVGEGDIEVNHDLIAAGHPRLNFEYGVYLANMPKHWDGKAEKKAYPDLEARVWALGQVASAEAALKLLARRASVREKPWPEFAEYNCFACHHDLADEKWRRDPRHVRGRPGALPWGDWYLALADTFPKLTATAAPADPEKAIKELRQLMERPYPDRKQVAKKAGALAARLETWLPEVQKQSWDAASVRKFLGALEEKAGKELGGSSWDEAGQLYLALEAFHYALRDLDPGSQDRRRGDLLKAMYEKLAFPLQFSSPRGFDPGLLEKNFKKFPR